MPRLFLIVLAVMTGCWRSAPPSAPVVATAQPSVQVVSAEGFDAQELEGGLPMRYQHLPAVSHDGSLIAVVEERDGWGHVVPGIRLLDRTGRTVQWLPLTDGHPAVARANAALAAHEWRELQVPKRSVRAMPEDGAEVTLSFGGLTAVYQQLFTGDYMAPPFDVRVMAANGTVLVHRKDTASEWAAAPSCNLPAFDVVGASATAGVVLFMTGLGMGGHNCDGVVQPPSWHVLAFPST